VGLGSTRLGSPVPARRSAGGASSPRIRPTTWGAPPASDDEERHRHPGGVRDTTRRAWADDPQLAAADQGTRAAMAARVRPGIQVGGSVFSPLPRSPAAGGDSPSSGSAIFSQLQAGTPRSRNLRATWEIEASSLRATAMTSRRRERLGHDADLPARPQPHGQGDNRTGAVPTNRPSPAVVVTGGAHACCFETGPRQRQQPATQVGAVRVWTAV
jgi:hypothetical protein